MNQLKKSGRMHSEGSPLSRSVWFDSPRVVKIVERTASVPVGDQLRIRALVSGISHGTEMLVYRGEVPDRLPLDLTLPTMEGSFSFPVKYGYASVGIVIGSGPDAGGISTGDLVFAYHPHETDYTISSRFVVGLPKGTAPKRAVFFANLEAALNAVFDAAPRLGECVVILGQGVLGLLITQLMCKAGAGPVITVDPIAKRRALSLAVGADFAVDPSEGDLVASIGERVGRGADLVIEASGRPEVLDDAIKAAAFEGRVIVVSWYGTRTASLDLGAEFHRNRITIRSSQVSNLSPRLGPNWTIDRRRHLAMSYLDNLALDELITHELPFEEAATAYEMIDRGPEEVVQVVLNYAREG